LRRCRTGTPTAAASTPARCRPGVAGLQHDALAEGATLAPVSPGLVYQQLADIVGAAGRRQTLDPVARTDARRWTRGAADPARDGVPAHAFPAAAGYQPGRLPQRDFDLGRGLGLLQAGGPPPAVTAVLLTPGDGRADWLAAGQALHRLLVHAASKWVFASLHTQPLEAAAIRALIRHRLALPGAPQLLLQLGLAHTTRSTGEHGRGLRAQELPPGRSATPRRGRDPQLRQYPPHRRGAGAAAQAGQFTLDPPIAPARVIPRHLPDQRHDPRIHRRPAAAAGIGPVPAGQPPVPAQQSVRRDQPAHPQRLGE
jgi:hypothetical protein